MNATDAAKISLLISVVDGTLVTPDKTLTPRALAAVRALAGAGIIFAVTSARPARGLAMLVAPLALSTPLAGFNGGVLMKPDMTIILQRTLPAEVARRTVDMSINSGMEIWVFSGANWFAYNAATPQVAREQRILQFAPIVADDFGSALDSAIKIVAVCEDYDRLAMFERELQIALGASATAARSQKFLLDITHPDANKGMVVTTLSEMYSIPASQIATIGDMNNDVSMFRKSGISVAMGNATPEVQKEATYVSAANTDEGFAKAVERYVLAPPAGEKRAS